MDELLHKLARSVTAWGGQVLWAEDTAQARRLILEVAARHGVTSVVKSKSMTTEEISLNPALAAAGISVRETDLGEFIVQLAGDPPAHITAPALHLDRRQIAAIFREQLGEAAPAEPAALTALATDYLRPKFYAAQMGITGVNFAAADGTLVLLENEANLRLTATLPPVHVALMGLEKIIPQLSDVEVLLRLLPASATGQRLTALVHFIKGLKPRPGGLQAFYLILLDNGRRRLAAHPELAEALACLRCGACLNVCPVFQAGGAHLYGRVYPGAIGILLAPNLAPVAELSDLCTQCGACQEICPVKISLAEKILYLRRGSRRGRGWRAGSQAAGLVLARPRLYRFLEPGLRGALRLWPWRRKHGLEIDFPPGSFHRQQQKRQSAQPSAAPGRLRPVERRQLLPTASKREIQVAETAPAPLLKQLAARLVEAGAEFCLIQGPAALARYLAEAAGPLWLADHSWLTPVARELEQLGVSPHQGGTDWAPSAHTAVSVALAAVPEMGSVLVEGADPAAWLGFKAQRLVLLVPAARSGFTFAQAVEFSRGQAAAMVSWLTGPSRTADIEKVLVIGAQGPRELAVVIYEGEH
jgi:L-lactate dehydrogenase complex protein LldF